MEVDSQQRLRSLFEWPSYFLLYFKFKLRYIHLYKHKYHTNKILSTGDLKMFDLHKSYSFSKTKANDGVKMIVGPDAENDYVLLRRIPNDMYKTKLSAVMLANKRSLEILKSQDEAAHAIRDTEIFCEVLAETVLIGWGKGFADEGKEVPYSVDKAKEILIKYPDFRSDLIEYASERKNFPAEVDVQDIKKK